MMNVRQKQIGGSALVIVMVIVIVYMAANDLGGSAVADGSDLVPLAETGGVSASEFVSEFDELVTTAGLELLVPDPLPADWTLLYVLPISSGGMLEFGPQGTQSHYSNQSAGTIRMVIGPQPAPDSLNSHPKDQFREQLPEDVTSFHIFDTSGQLIFDEGERGPSHTYAKVDLSDVFLRVIGIDVPADQIIEFMQSLRPWTTDAIPGKKSPDIRIGPDGNEFFEMASDSGFPLLVPDYLPLDWMEAGETFSAGPSDNTAYMDLSYVKLTWDAWGGPETIDGSIVINQSDSQAQSSPSLSHISLDEMTPQEVLVGETPAILYSDETYAILAYQHADTGMNIKIGSEDVSSEELIKIAESLRPY